MSAEDRKALGIGLAMHTKGQSSLRKVSAWGRQLLEKGAPQRNCFQATQRVQGKLAEALQELLLAEEAFDVASPALTEGIDNVALLLLDIVW